MRIEGSGASEPLGRQHGVEDVVHVVIVQPLRVAQRPFDHETRARRHSVVATGTMYLRTYEALWAVAQGG